MKIQNKDSLAVEGITSNKQATFAIELYLNGMRIVRTLNTNKKKERNKNKKKTEILYHFHVQKKI